MTIFNRSALVNKHSISRSLISLVAFILLIVSGHSMAEQSETMERQGKVNEIHTGWNTLVIDDMEYQVPPNVMVNGVTSPRAYLFGRLTEGAVVTLVAERQDGGLRLLEIRIER